MVEYFEFEVALRGAKPKIWRKFILTKTATFKDLHDAIQIACGWHNSHLYSFQLAGRNGEEIASSPHADDGFGEHAAPPANKVKLAKYFPDIDKCLYTYDFGDGWEHEVKLKSIQNYTTSFKRKLIAGKRAFPPEDCGGLPGYETCAAVATGKMEDEDDLKEWLPKGWHPEFFHLEETQKYFDK